MPVYLLQLVSPSTSVQPTQISWISDIYNIELGIFNEKLGFSREIYISVKVGLLVLKRRLSFFNRSFVSLLNGMSNFVGYLIPKPSLLKNSSDTIQLIAGG